MRKLIAAIAMALTLGSLMAPAPAVARERQKFSSLGLDAFWHSTRRIDRDHYLRITWYAGAYLTETKDGTEFWSDLYKDVARCEKRPGRDRCRTEAFQVGIRESLGEGEWLRVDRRLTTGALRATYTMRKRVDRRWVRTGQRITIDATLTGVGEIYRYEYSESSWQGHCLEFSYESDYQRRESEATGTLSGDIVVDLGTTADAGLSRSRGRVVENDCGH